MSIINDKEVDWIIAELKNGKTVSYSLGLTITTIQFKDGDFMSILWDQRDRMEFKTIFSEEAFRLEIVADKYRAFSVFLNTLKEQKD